MVLVGLNWSGNRATGYDLTPDEVISALDSRSTADQRSFCVGRTPGRFPALAAPITSSGWRPGRASRHYPWVDESEPPVGSEPARFDRDFWDERWAEVLRGQPEVLARRAPSGYLTGEAGGLKPGRALDAGCGHGGEALWLAARGWRVTAVDFSAAALTYGRSAAEALDVADRVDWVEADLGQWKPEPAAYDLVSSLYVHVSGRVEEMVQRLASGVNVGGRLLMVGHLPVDPVTGAETRAAGQVQVTVEGAVAALDPAAWDMATAETRRRFDGNGHDAVISAQRLR